MDTIRSFFMTVGTSTGGQIPAALHDLARRALLGHPVVEDAEAARDVVQSLVARAIGDVRAGRTRSWREFGTMDDRALARALKTRLRQTASEQDPLRLERHAISQHEARALGGRERECIAADRAHGPLRSILPSDDQGRRGLCTGVLACT